MVVVVVVVAAVVCNVKYYHHHCFLAIVVSAGVVVVVAGLGKPFRIPFQRKPFFFKKSCISLLQINRRVSFFQRLIQAQGKEC